MFQSNRGKEIDITVLITKRIHRKSWGDNGLYLYSLIDKDGNAFTITSLSSGFSVGERWRIKGKIKKSTNFCGILQSHIVNWIMEHNPEKE